MNLHLDSNFLARSWRKVFTSIVLGLVHRYTSGRVITGPFKGLQYPPPFDCGNAVPAKLLGIYEKELHESFVALTDHDFSDIVNIGASEGYYAAGLARIFPGAEVFAYEASPEARENLKSVLAYNRLGDRIHVGEYCDSEKLTELGHRLNPGKTLVICDIEGGELEVLDPEKTPWLRQSFIIFETHDFNLPGSSEKIIGSFVRTHQALRIPTVHRGATDLPLSLPAPLLRRVLLIVGDQRSHLGEQDFVVLTPHAGQDSTERLGGAQ